LTFFSLKICKKIDNLPVSKKSLSAPVIDTELARLLILSQAAAGQKAGIFSVL
jgi:hypothetical protein